MSNGAVSRLQRRQTCCAPGQLAHSACSVARAAVCSSLGDSEGCTATARRSGAALHTAAHRLLAKAKLAMSQLLRPSEAVSASTCTAPWASGV